MLKHDYCCCKHVHFSGLFYLVSECLMRYPPKTVLETRDHDSPGADPTYLLRRIVRGQWSNRNLVSSGPRGCNGWLCSLLRQTIVGLSPQSAGSSGLFPA